MVSIRAVGRLQVPLYPAAHRCAPEGAKRAEGVGAHHGLGALHGEAQPHAVAPDAWAQADVACEGIRALSVVEGSSVGPSLTRVLQVLYE